MALQTSLNGSQQRGKKPARQHKEKAEEVQEGNADAKRQWVEDAPFYLDAIESFQATLTEEEKEAIHLSFQE